MKRTREQYLFQNLTDANDYRVHVERKYPAEGYGTRVTVLPHGPGHCVTVERWSSPRDWLRRSTYSRILVLESRRSERSPNDKSCGCCILLRVSGYSVGQ